MSGPPDSLLDGDSDARCGVPEELDDEACRGGQLSLEAARLGGGVLANSKILSRCVEA
jgi:hypothetical protein